MAPIRRNVGSRLLTISSPAFTRERIARPLPCVSTGHRREHAGRPNHGLERLPYRVVGFPPTMLDEIASRVNADFARARSRAFLSDILSFLLGRPKRLLSYDQVKEKLHIGGRSIGGSARSRLPGLWGASTATSISITPFSR